MAIPQPYNLTGIGNSSDHVALIANVSDVLLKGMFGSMVVITIWVILFLSFQFKTGSPTKAFVTSSFLSFILTVLLRLLDLVPDVFLYTTLAITAFAVAFVRRRD